MEGCPKLVVKASSTSNLAQNLDARHKNRPAYAEQVRQDAHASVGKGPADDKGIVAFSNRDDSAVQQRLVLTVYCGRPQEYLGRGGARVQGNDAGVNEEAFTATPQPQDNVEAGHPDCDRSKGQAAGQDVRLTAGRREMGLV